jgi:hypothetical protein
MAQKDENPKKKKCFLITPIDKPDSSTRRRVDQWYKAIYEPALGDEYEIIRADMIAAPGIITEQIIEHIVDADLAIIDYTGLNPNVMYEAAIRLLTEKPTIQIRENSISLPFDIHNLRSLSYNADDLLYPKKLEEDIKKCLEEIKDPEYKPPQLIKEKFDFKKITADPEKFVELLKKHFIVPENSGGSGESIVTIPDPYNGFLVSASNIGMYNQKKIVCPNPKCKTIKYVNETGLSSPLTLSSIYNGYGNSFSLAGNHHYKCNNCGTEFEA